MKIFCFLILFFCSTFCIAREYTLEGKAGYFYPTDSRFEKMYSHGAIYGLEFNMQAGKHIYLWSEVDFYHKTGRTKKEFGPVVNGSVPCTLEIKRQGNEAHVTLVPWSLGLKYFTKVAPVRFYFGAGFVASYLHSHVSSAYLASKTTWGIGGAFKSGLLFTIKKSFLINLFSDYYFIDFDMDRPHHKKVITHDVDVNAWIWGGGLGYSF